MRQIDPVCGMTIEKGDAAGSFEYQGETYYFRNPGCLARFKGDPKRFLKQENRVPIAAGVVYPLTGTLISPIWASAAMTVSSVSVIGNALRLRRAQL